MPDTNCARIAPSEDYYDYLIAPAFVQEYGTRRGYCIQTIGSTAGVLYLPVGEYPPPSLATLKTTPYSSIPKLYGLTEGTITNDIRSISMQQDDFFGLDGNGVIIGIIGTGIDYTSDYFRQSDGSTRIVGIWDQTIESGTPPANIPYGSAYTAEDINAALSLDDPYSRVPSIDENGFGTYIASASAASDHVNPDFRGVAYASSIAAVKLKEAKPYLKDFFAVRADASAYQENDIMLAIKYLCDLADSLSLPLVICLCAGSSIGNHSSTSFLSNYIDEISIGNHCVVCGTGDEANRRHHYYGTFSKDEPYIDVEVQVEDNNNGFFLELWGQLPDVYTIAVISPSGEILERIPYQMGSSRSHYFLLERSELSIAYPLILQQHSNPLIIMRMRAPSNGIWTFRIYGANLTFGQFNMWLSIQQFLEGNTFFLASTPDTTLTDPASSILAISVAAYDSLNNSVYLESGRGYPLIPIIKPSFASPGVGVPGINLSGRRQHRSGTSPAAAITAGTCALVFEWGNLLEYDSDFSASRILPLLIRGADRQINRNYPNREWGYGTLNLTASLQALLPI